MMTEYKTIDGKRYAMSGYSTSKVTAQNRADKLRKQGVLVRVVKEERKSTPVSRGLKGYRMMYVLYTRSK